MRECKTRMNQSQAFLAADLVNMSLPDLLGWLRCRRKNNALDRDVLGLARDLAGKVGQPARRQIFARELKRMTNPSSPMNRQNENTPYWLKR